MPDEVLPIQSKRRARFKRVQLAQHTFAAGILILTAVDHLTNEHEHHLLLPLLEIAAGATMLGAVIVEKVRKTHAHVAWVEFAGAAMMFVEAIAKTQVRHHFLFYVLSFIPPLALLFFAIFDARIEKALSMKATDDALELRLRVIWRRRIPWEGLTGYRITAKHIELHRDDGKSHTLRIDDIVDREAAVAWAVQQFEQRGLRPL